MSGDKTLRYVIQEGKDHAFDLLVYTGAERVVAIEGMATRAEAGALAAGMIAQILSARANAQSQINQAVMAAVMAIPDGTKSH